MVPTDTVKLALAGEISLAVAVKLRDGEAVPARLRFESSDPSVVAVDSTGKIKALSRGVALVRVKVLGAAAGRELPSAGVNVRVIVAAIRLARTAETMTAVGDTILVSPGYLDARGNPIAASDSARIVPALSLVCSGRAVALGSGARVIAKANGVDTVKVVVDTSSAFLVVSVQQLIESVGVEPDSFTFTALTDTARFRAVVLDRRRNPVADPPLTWRTSDSARVAIAPSGLATARDTGFVELTLEAGGKVARARVRVIQRVDMVDLRPGAGLPDDSVLVMRRLGARRQLVVRVLDRRAQVVKGARVRWESHHDSVAVVDSAGVVTALRDGRASVVARGWSPADSASRRDSLIVVVDRYTLEVAVTGRGLVRSQSGVLTCDARSSGQCSASVRLDSGWVDTLRAEPATGWVFGGWGRSCSGTGTSCAISLTSSLPVSAAFVPVPPVAPTNLVATAVSATRIDLSWADNANNEDGFRIERCVGSGCSSFVQVATVGVNVTAYQDTGLTAATSYSYRVRAYNAGGNSGYSNTATATTLPNAPAAPSNLVATAVSASQVNLSWTDNASNEDGFKIERCAGSGCSSFVEIATVGANVTTYQNTGLTAGTSYSYRVRAYNAGGNSSYSNTATAATPLNPPAAPSNLVATAVSASQISLSWTDNAADEGGFRIERCTGYGCTNFTQIATVGANITTYQDGGLTGGTANSYRVRAYNAGGSSGYSNVAGAWTITVLQSNVAVSGMGDTANSVRVFQIDVAANTGLLRAVTAGGSGDADLYLRYGAVPTLGTYDCRSWSSTTAEECLIPNPSAGTWYVMVHGYTQYSAVNLTASAFGLVWAETFEATASGSWPSNWVKDANANDGSTNRVTNTVRYEGSNSLQLFGVLGGCWGAIAYRSLTVSPPIYVEVVVRNGAETTSGCHPDRAGFGVRQCCSWTNPQREFVTFRRDGTVTSSGNSVATYQSLTWYRVGILYERVSASEVRLIYWVDGSYKGSRTFSAIAQESNLGHLELGVNGGSAWFDNVRVFRP